MTISPVDTQQIQLQVIARIHTDFPEKFGIPRQAGLVEQTRGEIVFEPAFRNSHSVRGLEGYSHIWLLWLFSKAMREDGNWSPTVRPPRLGGNTKVGVFATRSPFRPNPIGLSCVRLREIRIEEGRGPVLLVSGADLLDGTPIFDIKPYLSFTDAHPEAVCGFSDDVKETGLKVDLPKELREMLPQEHLPAILGLLSQDPRPSYQEDPDRIYGIAYAGYNIRFHVSGGILTVCEVCDR